VAHTNKGFESKPSGTTKKETSPMRTKFLLMATLIIAAMILMPTASAKMPSETSSGVHAVATTEDAMTYAAASATPTTLLSATEVTCADVCEAGTFVALTTISAANIAMNTNNENAAGQMVLKKPMTSGSFNGAFADTAGMSTCEVAFAAHEIVGAAIAFA
jgi:hypothetical protein